MKRIVFTVLAALVLITALAAQNQDSNSVIFTVQALPPGPTITTIAPAKSYPGAAVNMTISGTNFAAGCVVNYDAAPTPAVIASATNITLTIPAAKVTLGTHTIVVSCPLPVLSLNSPVTLPNAQVGKAYSADLKSLAGVSGGVPPYNFSLVTGGLPTGLSLSSGGAVAGSAALSGTFSFDYTVTDSSGLTQRGVVSPRILAAKR